MKLRSFFTILASVVGVLLLATAVGFYWLFSQSPLNLLGQGQGVTPAAAMFVPKQAPAMTSLLVNPDQLAAFRLAAAAPGERRQARAELTQFRQNLLANTGLTYEQDIKPWLGKELTLAVTTLDIDRDAVNGNQPGYLLAIATTNPERSREFLQLFWQKRAIAGTDLVFEQYKGVKLIYGSKAEAPATQKSPLPKNSKLKTQNSKLLTPNSKLSLPPTPSLASAAVGDRFILFANHPKVLRDAINNVQAPDLSLSSARFYTQALETLTQPRIGLAFVNLPGLSTWLSENLTVADKTVPGDAPPYQTMAIALELDRHGLLAETALSGDKKTSIPAPLSQPVTALQYLPSNSAVSASGINLERLWSELSTDLKSYETVAQLVNQPLADLQKRWQIDLPKDIFSWVKGEYALGFIPNPDGQPPATGKKKGSPPPALPNDWIFVTQRLDSGSAKQGIERLDAIAKSQGLSVGPLKLGDQTVFAWTRLTTGAAQATSAPALQAEVLGVHTSVGTYEVFTNSIAALDRVLKAAGTSQVKDAQFQQAIAPIQQPNNGYLYLDWATIQPLLEQQFPLLKLVELTSQPLFNHLDALTLSSYGSQSGVQRGGVFVKLN